MRQLTILHINITYEGVCTFFLHIYGKYISHHEILDKFISWPNWTSSVVAIFINAITFEREDTFSSILVLYIGKRKILDQLANSLNQALCVGATLFFFTKKKFNLHFLKEIYMQCSNLPSSMYIGQSKISDELKKNWPNH